MPSLYQTTKELLGVYNRHARKGLGQNFLIDQGVLSRIIATADLSLRDTVLEIGTGLGVLTQALAEKAGKVITIDKDKEMVDISKKVLGECSNIEFIGGDFLDWGIPEGINKVVANVPYYITTPIIEKLLTNNGQLITKIVLTIQREVAERITATPGTKKYGSFTVFVQNRADVEIDSYVSRRSFYPQPNVDSAILAMNPLGHPRFNIKEEIVRAAFSQRRKTIRNTLKKFNIDFGSIGIDSGRRAETLSLADFESISKSIPASL